MSCGFIDIIILFILLAHCQPTNMKANPQQNSKHQNMCFLALHIIMVSEMQRNDVYSCKNDRPHSVVTRPNVPLSAASLFYQTNYAIGSSSLVLG
jgi:hypothetical protein